MKMIIMAFIVVWGFFLPKFSSAQLLKTKISGQVLDADKKPVDGATISLVTAKDSILIKTELAAADGNFVFENIKSGDYKVAITTVGFKPYRGDAFSVSEQNPVIALPAIILLPNGTVLKGVAITAQKSFIEHKTDRTVVNVDALISNAGTSAFEVLEKSPGVQIDQNGAVSLKGKGVTIFIDDKPTYLSG